MTRGITASKAFAGLAILGGIGKGISAVASKLGYNNQSLQNLNTISNVAIGVGLVGGAVSIGRGDSALNQERYPNPDAILRQEEGRKIVELNPGRGNMTNTLFPSRIDMSIPMGNSKMAIELPMLNRPTTGLSKDHRINDNSSQRGRFLITELNKGIIKRGSISQLP